MPLRIFHIAGSTEQAMLRIFRLGPLLRQHLGRKELRRALLDQVIVARRKHVICAPTVRTSRVGR